MIGAVAKKATEMASHAFGCRIIQRPRQREVSFEVIHYVCISPNSLLWGSLLEKKAGRCMPWSRPRSCPPCVHHVSAMCPPCVCPESALAAPPNFVHHVSAMYQPCVSGLVSALCPPSVLFGRVSTLCPPCVRHVSAWCPALCPLWLCLQALSAMCPPCLLSTMCPLKPCLWTLSALGLLLGEGHGIIRQNSFAPLRNPQHLYCMPAGQCPSYILFGSPNSAKRTLCLKNGIILCIFGPD